MCTFLHIFLVMHVFIYAFIYGLIFQITFSSPNVIDAHTQYKCMVNVLYIIMFIAIFCTFFTCNQ